MYTPLSINLATFGSRLPLHSGLLATFGYHDFDTLPDEFETMLVSKAQALLIEQFEDSHNIRELIDIIVKPLQQAENIALQLGTARDLNTVTGIFLDAIGEILGLPRKGLLDEDYRKLLKLKAILNRSSGEPENLILALKTFTNANTIHYFEWYPAKVYLQYTSIFLPPSNLQALLQALAVGGVKVIISWSNTEDPLFCFAGEGIYPPPPNTAGFNEVDYNVGGKFIEVLF